MKSRLDPSFAEKTRHGHGQEEEHKDARQDPQDHHHHPKKHHDATLDKETQA